MLLETDPPKHTRYRKLVNKGFTPRMIGLLEQYLTHRSTLIIDEVIEQGSCDFVTDLAAELPLQAIAEIMGVPQEDRKLLFDWSNRMIGSEDPEYAGDENQPPAMTELYGYVNNLAKLRKEEPRDDIVTKLINSEIDGDRLSDAEFEFFMLLLTVAGNETTRNTTSWGMHALMQHPEQYQLLRENPELLDGAVEEILRWASPVYYFRRTAMADTVIHGQEIAKDDKVVMWYISANRDETVYDDPFRFDITRTGNEHVAFGGGGTHFCLGANLARAELRILFAELHRAHRRHEDDRRARHPAFELHRRREAHAGGVHTGQPAWGFLADQHQRLSPSGPGRWIHRPRATSSAICSVLRAAPFRRLSPQTKSSSTRGSSRPRLMRPT